jgi:Fe-S-cluster containining protein
MSAGAGGAHHGAPGNREVWLDPDTYYVCQRCTNCCRWPGDVRLEAGEAARIAGFLGLSEAEFIERHTRLRSDRRGLSLIEKPNHECVMLKKGACRIHEVKPVQCAGFPNQWNFSGWQKECEAMPIPMTEARALGLADPPDEG